MPTPLGSLNLTDITTLGLALTVMTGMIHTLQDMSQCELPKLCGDLQSSVSGVAVQDHLNNLSVWTTNTANMLIELRGLYNYLAPIYIAACGNVNVNLALAL